jgi:transcriptional regulator with XRE-family HTH domain
MEISARIRIGERIASLRKERGWSQADLADITGLKQPNIARIEKGLYSTGFDLIEKIAAAFDKKIDIV